MTRYHFHLWDGRDYEVVDETGAEFENADAACLEALQGAREIWIDLLRERRNPAGYRYDIFDDQGRSIHEISFSEAMGVRVARRLPQSDWVTLATRGYALAAELTREIVLAQKNLRASRELLGLSSGHPES